MTLCALCKAIPWENLPSITSAAEDVNISNLSNYLNFYGDVRWPEDGKRVPHHQSFEALRNSANQEHCGICQLILEDVEYYYLDNENLKQNPEIAQTITRWPSWEFYVVKRFNQGDGCWFVTDVTEGSDGGGIVVAGIGLCVRDGDPLERMIRGRPAERQGSPASLSKARTWLNECNKHPGCNSGESLLPSRVIDLGEDGSESPVKLRETDSQERGLYIALSYCWGKTQQLTTTKSTIQDRKQQIPISDLSKTHKDVVQVAREMGIRYIWIDSVCIVQDDHENWEEESSKMLSVYANAYLTIAASHAEDSSKGLFSNATRKYVDFEYTCGDLQGRALAFCLPMLQEFHPELYIYLSEEPLSTRGWALQERVLSRRTLFYSAQQMFFECDQGFRSEDDLFLGRRFHKLSIGVDEDPTTENSNGSTGLNDRERFNTLEEWQDLVNLYQDRKLTNASDKLTAISGIARSFAKKLRYSYVAGHWMDMLTSEVLWKGSGYRADENGAPSWSWASMNGSIDFNRQHHWGLKAEVMDIDASLGGSNTHGEVTEGKIRLKAPMASLHFDLTDWDPARPGIGHEPYPKIELEDVEDTDMRYNFDSQRHSQNAEQRILELVKSWERVGIFALITLYGGWRHLQGKQVFESSRGLIVSKVEGREEYRRLGHISISSPPFYTSLQEREREVILI